MSRAVVIYTRADVERELRAVHRELAQLGLLTRAVKDVPLKTPLTDIGMDLAYAQYFYGKSWWMPLYGVEVGDLLVPLGSVQRGLDRLGRRHLSFRQTLRHELGHALAYTSPAGLIRRSPAFVAAFGAHHDAARHVASRRSEVLLPYCLRNPSEDFAETFAWYVRAHGDIRRMQHRPSVYRKLQFVDGLRRRLKMAAKAAT